MSNLEDPNSPQVKVMLEWDQGFQKRDPTLLAKYLHKDYRHTYYPRSLGKSELTREQWLEYIAGVIGLWTDREVGYIDYHSNLLRHD